MPDPEAVGNDADADDLSVEAAVDLVLGRPHRDPRVAEVAAAAMAAPAEEAAAAAEAAAEAHQAVVGDDAVAVAPDPEAVGDDADADDL